MSGLLCGLLLTSCGWSGMFDECEDQPGYGRQLGFRLVDATGAVLALDRFPFHRDTVKLFFLTPTRREQYPNFSGYVGTGYNTISVIRYGEPPLYGVDYTDSYLLYLNRADQDTITLHYRLFQTKCKDADLDGIRISYNGREVFNGPRGVTIGELELRKR